MDSHSNGSSSPATTPEPGVVRGLRTFLLALLVMSMIGVATELVFLAHIEGYWQKLPLILLGIGFLALTAHWIFPGRATLRGFQSVMLLFVISGAIGIFLHYTGNEEFELEMYPELKGWDLLRESLTGATPVLAPAAMSQIGLIGLAFAFRHPSGRSQE